MNDKIRLAARGKVEVATRDQIGLVVEGERMVVVEKVRLVASASMPRLFVTYLVESLPLPSPFYIFTKRRLLIYYLIKLIICQDIYGFTRLNLVSVAVSRIERYTFMNIEEHIGICQRSSPFVLGAALFYYDARYLCCIRPCGKVFPMPFVFVDTLHAIDHRLCL